ncbi:MAG: PAS domain S-box protein [Desulfobacteraceae bacterium]|nr:MAG: PAS domain S-box protein [Desulfobacteraceae bacterium]
MRLLGKTIGHCRILNQIYESPSSVIYRAIRQSDRKPVVLKVLKQNHPAKSEWNRYRHEYEILGKLRDVKNVIRAYSLDPYHKTLVMVLEDFGGESLKSSIALRLASGKGLPLEDFIALALELARGLAGIHDANVIHKNINPTNVLFNRATRQLKLIDFGFSSILGSEYPSSRPPEMLEGSLHYIAPEQTGRMNREVDYRSDLYSLGVTLYEILTGRLPFEGDDPLTLIHAHMAKMPRPPMDLNPTVPPMISDMVMRLMAKNAEDRYQSAFGLTADLERFRKSRAGSKGGEDLKAGRFELGRDDYCGQFHLQQRLYGRDPEISELLSSFGRAAAGNQEVVFVGGYAGVGKSSLVAEIHKPVTAKRAYFISGKFEQFQRKRPYFAFTQAFNQFVEVLLTEQEEKLRAWRDKILAALDGNGAVLTEVMPSLVKIIGPQLQLPIMSGQENRNRFNLAFRNFVKAVSTAEHPLVLFIDDMQWADPSSLELISVLLSGGRITHQLFIGAYRDNEVDIGHPLIMTMNQLAAAGAAVRKIEVGNLQQEDVRQLTKDSLSCSEADSRALAELIHSKTQGNAFFTRQFLRNLFEEGLLRFDFDARRWNWDIEKIKAQKITDNVVDLMTGRLRRLPPETSKLLQLASCIGSEFDLRTLALLSRTEETLTLHNFMEALVQGLVLPLDDFYKLDDTAAQARFVFLHDRVQQAAFALIPSSERQALQLKIARLLLDGTPASELDNRVFDILQHYNEGAPLISDGDERMRLAELNMTAAERAYGAAAFRSARDYLLAALVLLLPDGWSRQYAVMLKLHSQLAAVFSLTGDFDQMERACQITERRAHTMADTARVKQARIQSLLYRGNYADAIELGLTFIEGMGIPVNRNPSPEEAFRYLQDTVDWLTDERIENLLHLPEASAEVGLILEVASLINGPAYNSNMHLFIVLVSQITRLCIEQGSTPWAPVNLTTFTVVLCAALHDIPKARLLTTVTMKLFDQRYRWDNPVSPLNLVIGGFALHRYEHLKQTLPVLAEGVQKGLNSGTFYFAAYCAWWQAWHDLFLGTRLEMAEAVSRQAEETCEKAQMERQKDWCLLVHQAILNLQGKSEIPWVLRGEVYDEQEKLHLAHRLGDMADVFRIFFYKGWLNYLFGSFRKAVKHFRNAEEYLLYGAGTYLVPLFYFYDTLANAAMIDRESAENRSGILERINRNLEQFEVWVRFAPVNHRHKMDLMEAEKARIENLHWQAVTLYKRSIKGAGENEFLHEEALAFELCGRFWLDQGEEEVAGVYLEKANRLYGSWGADAKVKQLRSRYGSPLGMSQARPHATMEAAADSDVPPSFEAKREITQALLDTASVMKANQILSQTVNTSGLLEEMIKILIESAGAEKAFVLCRDEKTWFIEGAGKTGWQPVQTGLHLPPSSDLLSMRIFNYVVNSQKVVVLANAFEDTQFGGDPYLREKSTKSVLCLPVRHEGELMLVLYLENNLTAGAFTEGRLGLLQLLSGQMAICYKNALMVDAMKKTIAERKRTEERLRQNEERLRMVVEGTSDGIWDWNAVADKVYASPRYFTVLGYEEGEIPPTIDSWRERLHPDDAEVTLNAVRQSLKNRVPLLAEYRFREKSGKYRWLQARGKAVEWDADGKVTRMAGSISDVSERKKAEEALRESAEQYRIMTSTSMDGFMIVDMDARILDVNEAYCRIVGYSRDELLKMSVHDLDVQEEMHETRSHIQRVIESGSDRFESRHRRKDGSVVDVEISLTSMRRSSRLLCFLRDVTEPKRAHEELRKAIQVLEKSPAVLFRLNAAKGFPLEFVSNNVTQFGYTVEELLSGRISFLSMIHPEDREWLGSEVRIADKRGDLHFQKVYRLVTKDGKSRWVDDRTMIERGPDGRATHHQGIILDITERKLAEEALSRHRDHLEELVRDRTRELDAAQEQLVKREKLSVLGQLTATVSHELRNPLGVIRSSAFYLQEKIKDRDQKIRKHLDRIETQVDLCDKIVGELLEYTRGSGSEMIKGEITPWLEKRLEDAQGTEGIRLTALLSDDLPEVSFDAGKMSRVMNNLLDNAVHAVKEMLKTAEEEKREYEPWIRVEASRAEGGIMIRVEDNGTGMDRETLRRASEPLFTTKARGTGLGLAIVKKIVEEHGGTLKLESELRRGTKANLWMPVHEELLEPGDRDRGR